jgi:hypothetical protein
MKCGGYLMLAFGCVIIPLGFENLILGGDIFAQ